MVRSLDARGNRGQRYVVPDTVTRDLESALSVALSIPPSYSPSTPRRSQASFVCRDPAVLTDLGDAVVRFVSKLKDEGAPPQNMLIALKTLFRQYASRTTRDVGVFDELQRIIVLAAVKSYFSGDFSADGDAIDWTASEPVRAEGDVDAPCVGARPLTGAGRGR